MTKSNRRSSESSPAVDTYGRITVPLGGADYVLRPSFEAIDIITSHLGRSDLELSGMATSGKLTIGEMAFMVCEMMKAHGRAESGAGPSYADPKPEKIGRLIFEAGSPRIMARLAVLLVGVVTGGYTAEGEAKPAT